MMLTVGNFVQSKRTNWIAGSISSYPQVQSYWVVAAQEPLRPSSRLQGKGMDCYNHATACSTALKLDARGWSDGRSN
jgi:hypothetical protein